MFQRIAISSFVWLMGLGRATDYRLALALFIRKWSDNVGGSLIKVATTCLLVRDPLLLPWEPYSSVAAPNREETERDRKRESAWISWDSIARISREIGHLLKKR